MKTIVFPLISISSLFLGAAEKEIWYDHQGKPVIQTDKNASSDLTTQPKDLVSAQPVNLQKIAPMPWSRSTRYRRNSSRDIFGFNQLFGWFFNDCYRQFNTPRGCGLNGWYQSNGQWGINYQRPGFSLQWCR